MNFTEFPAGLPRSSTLGDERRETIPEQILLRLLEAAAIGRSWGSTSPKGLDFLPYMEASRGCTAAVTAMRRRRAMVTQATSWARKEALELHRSPDIV
ncbi:hypothetical protein [Sorangium sp. So ce426]|uniref:hypothetical protein n=1 Tax=Sorangium sp. So ce426 TaxID=3133312 RepID=UPI003F5C211E